MDCVIEAAGDRVDQAKTPEAREERLWALFFLVQQSEGLGETLERARQRVDAFQASFADDHEEPSDADAVAYEVLKTEIAAYLRRH